LQNSDLHGPLKSPPGARESRLHPYAPFLWLALSLRPVLKGAGLSAATSTVKPKQTQGAVPGRSEWRRWPRLCPTWCGRDARAPGGPSSTP